MRRGRSGNHESWIVDGEACRTFVPAPLPPRPELALDAALQERLASANLALGRLDGVSMAMPEAFVLPPLLVRKEAVMSSRLEGSRVSLADLLLGEAGGVPAAPAGDVRQVLRCVVAMETGVARMRQGMPICLRLIDDMHERLMPHAHGARSSPAHRAGGGLPDLVRFINDDAQRQPALIKAALASLQFDAIPARPGGNGLLGRLLVPLMLVADGVLREPLLPLSLSLDAHRSDYERLRHDVREHGDWEAWISFFVAAVEVAALHAVNTALAIRRLFDADGARLAALAEDEAMRVHHLLLSSPVARAGDIAACLRGTSAVVDRGIAALASMDIVRTVCGTAGQGIVVYTAYLDLLNREDP